MKTADHDFNLRLKVPEGVNIPTLLFFIQKSLDEYQGNDFHPKIKVDACHISHKETGISLNKLYGPTFIRQAVERENNG